MGLLPPKSGQGFEQHPAERWGSPLRSRGPRMSLSEPVTLGRGWLTSQQNNGAGSWPQAALSCGQFRSVQFPSAPPPSTSLPHPHHQPHPEGSKVEQITWFKSCLGHSPST